MKHLTIAFAAAALLAAPIAVAHEAPESIELPVGDGHVTDHPATGNVYSCQTAFRGGGAMHVGEWFHGDTWNPAEKPHVEGRVMWPNAEFELSQRGDVLGVSGNSLPVEQPTGTFPISPNDPVFRYDRNPNPMEEVTLAFEIPAAPVRAASPSCLPMGMIGFTLTGVAIYNALDAAGRDAAAHEVQDLCDGHPQGRGQYHYHSASPCLPGAGDNAVVGWALDGYPILGMRDASGALIVNADLDACHGRAEAIDVGGRHYDYAYRLTREYPYTLGCFTGQVLDSTRRDIHQGMGPPRDRGPFGRPPLR
ncbi:MAG: YHYH protein [Hyphomonadaceae bacterium]|nr:YHYH protein [Hyphomonadaceae bacterium]